jgi:hypothetical protein
MPVIAQFHVSPLLLQRPPIYELKPTFTYFKVCPSMNLQHVCESTRRRHAKSISYLSES